MIAIDTNVMVRYLTGDHPEQSARARDLVDGQPVFVGVTVMLEVEWVLRGAYDHSPADITRVLRAFAGLPTVSVEDEVAVANALDLVDKGIDFADALHLSRSAHCTGFATFDRKFVRAARAAGHENVEQV
jgi:predicted nucleic acid-binding protein